MKRRDFVLAGAAALSAPMAGPSRGSAPGTFSASCGITVCVTDFGAIGDGVTDDTNAFIDAIAHLDSIGGGILLANGLRFKITSKLHIAVNNVLIQGIGRSTSHDVGINVPGTEFQWYGPSGDTMVEFSPIPNSSNQRGFGGGLIDIALNGRQTADNGLAIKSWNGGVFAVYGVSCERTIVEMDVVPTLGEARDTQFNEVNIYGRQFSSPQGSTLMLSGDSTANVSFNRFTEINSTYANGNCLEIGNSDSNDFGLVRLNSGGGTGIGLVLRGSNASPAECARGNRFQMLSPGSGGIRAFGTSTYAHPSKSNIIEWFDDGNGSPDPVIEAGASLYWGNQHNADFRPAFGAVALGESVSSAMIARDQLGTETLRIRSTSSNHVRLADSAGNEWALFMSGGDLRIARMSGTGKFQVTNNLQMSAVGFNNTAPIAKPTVSGSRGGNAALTSLLAALANYGLITNSTT